MYEYAARLNRVIDGDTFVLDIDLGFYVQTTQHVRLFGIDCPEHGTVEGDLATKATAEWFSLGKNGCVVTTDKAQTKTFDRWVAVVGPPPQVPGLLPLERYLRLAGHFKKVERLGK